MTKFLMQWMFLNILIAGIVSQKANASWITEGRKINSSEVKELMLQPKPKRTIKEGFMSGPKVCDMEKKLLKESSLENLKQQAAAAANKSKWCEEAFIWSEVRRQYPVRPHYRLAWLETINSLVKGNDYIEAINQANDFLDEIKQDPQNQEVRLLLILSVVKGIRATYTEVDQEWARYSLGIEAGQGSTDDNLQNLILGNFIGQFPHSTYAPLVEAFIVEARNKITAYNLIVAKNYIQDKEYYAAILRLKINLQYGIIVQPFAESMYEMIHAHLLFADLLQNDKKLKDKKLREWLGMESETPIDRGGLATATRDQARSFLTIMEQQLPSSEWTTRARDILRTR